MRRNLDDILKAIEHHNTILNSKDLESATKYKLIFWDYNLGNDINDSGYPFAWSDPDGSTEDVINAYMKALNEFADKHRALQKIRPMQWVKCRERMPDDNDKTSIDVDGHAIMRYKIEDGRWYTTTITKKTFEKFYMDYDNYEWLEGAFQ